MSETTFQFTTAATDPEVQHLDVAVQLFEKLDAAEQGRMLAYLNARYPDFLRGIATSPLRETPRSGGLA